MIFHSNEMNKVFYIIHNQSDSIGKYKYDSTGCVNGLQKWFDN